ncbi:MAG: hypothetical protein AB1297_04240, partial [bacterium]
MNFLKNLFKKKKSLKEEQEELDIKHFIGEFIASGMLNRLKSKNVIENAEFILNTLLESKLSPNMGKMEAMGIFLKIRKKVSINQENLKNIQKLFKLYFKFLDEKGLVTDEIKEKIAEEGLEIPQTIKRKTPKIGRNSPCPCG